MRVVEVAENDRELIGKIHENELHSFGALGGADMWMIMSFVRYGKLYVLLNEEDELLSVAQYQGILGKNEAFLYGFSTPIEERGKGYGKILLKESQKELKKINIEKIYLTVDPKNITAVKMYEKDGYVIIELHKDEYGIGVDRYLMVKEL
ncbi:MAG: GNAT family N-acetyltransferase [Cetobacterium sp.]